MNKGELIKELENAILMIKNPPKQIKEIKMKTDFYNKLSEQIENIKLLEYIFKNGFDEEEISVTQVEEAVKNLLQAYKEDEVVIDEKNKIIKQQKQQLHELKFDLKSIKKDLDFEPWSIYKVDGEKLFDMATILEREE